MFVNSLKSLLVAISIILSSLSLVACGGGSPNNPNWENHFNVSGISPNTAPVGGGNAAVHGAGLSISSIVTFDGIPAQVTGANPTTLWVTAPAHAAGTVDVVVENPDGAKATLKNAFTYEAPPQTAEDRAREFLGDARVFGTKEYAQYFAQYFAVDLSQYVNNVPPDAALQRCKGDPWCRLVLVPPGISIVDLRSWYPNVVSFCDPWYATRAFATERDGSYVFRGWIIIRLLVPTSIGLDANSQWGELHNEVPPNARALAFAMTAIFLKGVEKPLHDGSGPIFARTFSYVDMGNGFSNIAHVGSDVYGGPVGVCSDEGYADARIGVAAVQQ